MRVYIVILHMGDLQVTKDCITSLVKHEHYYAKIVVVNNDTTILSQKEMPYKNLVVINNKKNLGFAGGVNVGIKYSLNHKADAVLLLNNDTYIKKSFLETLTKVMDNDTTIGIIGPAICFEKNGKKIFDIGGSINMQIGRTSHKEVGNTKAYKTRYVTYITGAAMLIKSEVFEKVGLFDENFFLYYEDADFCLRAQAKGFQIAVEPSSAVYHFLSKTIGKVSPFAVYHQTRSAMGFGKKYMSSFPKNLIHILFIITQTIKITLTYPKAGLAGLRAMIGLDL